jgi:putative tryptophan/tyrosine transport system substrate-binding protein
MEIGRRGFLHLAGNAIVAWPLSARSQQGSNLPIVAVLLPATFEVAKIRTEAIRKGLQEEGFREGVHYVVELRFADGQRDRLPGLARELQLLRPAVFVVGGSLLAALELQPRPPMVFTAIALDPVEWGIVESYVRPGGMITGNVLNALRGEDTIAENALLCSRNLSQV